ncbi:MAG: phosphoribosylaminoimidazolesuccinocarboxamide synthase [Pirellulales bacterium]
MTKTLLTTELPGLPVVRGKVRDIYDLGNQLLLVATDRISAFDHVLPNGIPDKGRILTELTAFWLEFLEAPNHLLSTNIDDVDLPMGSDLDQFSGRSMLVRKAEVLPVECVARGYLAGSAWQEYQSTGKVCGFELPGGLRECDKLPEPIFTPATKAERGEHDENISFARAVETIGQDRAELVRMLTLELYGKAAQHAESRGVIIADTKFEFGVINEQVILIDEVLTPDSSRFWPADDYKPGRSQPSFDKQYVRDWLLQSGWDRNSPPPALPEDVVAKTRQKYVEAYEKITGREFE